MMLVVVTGSSGTAAASMLVGELGAERLSLTCGAGRGGSGRERIEELDAFLAGGRSVEG